MRAFVFKICVPLLFLLSFSAWGQTLPSLPSDPAISRGKLPNGIEFFLASTKDAKGLADFSLVQTGLTGGYDARKILSDIPGFPVKPYEFLARNGIACTESGYVEDRGNASVFTFRNVPMYNKSAADSTLLMLFGIASASPTPQAVVICGDVDKNAVRERMGLFSMMVPVLEEPVFEDGYLWEPKEDVSYRLTYNQTRDVASVNMIISAERTGRALLNTAVPLISASYAADLGYIAKLRLSRAFRKAGIPLAEVRYKYVDAAGSPGDEYYSFTIYTSYEYLDRAAGLMATVLATIDKDGVSYGELVDAKEYTASNIGAGASLTDKCIAAFLYGTNLAPDNVIRSYTVSRSLPDHGELDLFNGFSSALLDSASNLTVRYDIPARKRWSSFNSFTRGWVRMEESVATKVKDLSDLPSSKGRVKLRSEAAEPISGGKIWTFSNGMRVIYKKTSSDGVFHYGLMVRGGMPDVPGLAPGEGAFVGDMLPLSYVAGMHGDEFQDALKAKGITMTTDVTLSDMRICGTAPKHGFHLLMNSLLALSRDRVPDNGAFEYYRKNEELRLDMQTLAPRDVNAIMDSIICPGNIYSKRKDISNLGKDLNVRAESYFARMFSKLDDGVLVFFGDLDEETLKRDLARTLGDFQTQKKSSPRAKVSYGWATGSKTVLSESVTGIVGGGEIGAYAALSAEVPFSLNSYMSLLVAEYAIRKALASVLSPLGAYAEISHKAEVYPYERITFYVNCHPCREAGLPSEVNAPDPMIILSALRSLTLRIGQFKISPEDMKAFKEDLLYQLEKERTNPDKLMESVMIRFSEGRDIVTGYKVAVESVTQESIDKVLTLLASGASVEYVII